MRMMLGFCCASPVAVTRVVPIIATIRRNQNRRASMCMSHPPVVKRVRLRLREERRKLVAHADPELVLLGRRRRPRWIPCRLQAHIPAAREELAHDKVDGDAARVLD